MGTNNLSSKSDGQAISSSDMNQYRTAFNGDIVPRNTSGVPTDLAGNVGDATYGFANVYADQYFVGDPNEDVSIEQNVTGRMSFMIGGVEKGLVNANGIDGGGLRIASVEGSSLVDLGVTAAKIAAATITGAKIANLTITGGLIAETTIPGSKITTGSIDSDRLEVLNKDLSVTTSAFSTASVSYVTVATAVITTARPVMLSFISDENGTNASSIVITGAGAFLQIKRGSTVLGIYPMSAGTFLPGSLQHIDFGLSGTGTYTVEAKVASGTVAVNYVQLLASEL